MTLLDEKRLEINDIDLEKFYMKNVGHMLNMK